MCTLILNTTYYSRVFSCFSIYGHQTQRNPHPKTRVFEFVLNITIITHNPSWYYRFGRFLLCVHSLVCVFQTKPHCRQHGPARKFSFATHMIQEYQHAINIIFVFVHNIHIHIRNLFSFQLRYTRTKMWPLTNTPSCLLFRYKLVIFIECKHLLKNI